MTKVDIVLPEKIFPGTRATLASKTITWLWPKIRLRMMSRWARACSTIERDPDDQDLPRLKAIKETRAAEAAAYFRKNAAQWDKIRALYVHESEVEKALLGLLPPHDIDDLVDIGEVS